MIADSIWTWVYCFITFVNDVILKIQLSMLLELYLTYPKQVIILFQTINYILEISYRFIEFVSLRTSSMDNILDCNEHKKCWNTAKMGYFPLTWMIFLQYLCNIIINSTLLWNVISQVRLACGMVSWQESCKPCRQNFP